MPGERRFYEQLCGDERRSAPAALRNRMPIAEVLGEWLPKAGLVLEIASGTGEHVIFFANRFPGLSWQPTDMDRGALASINGWRKASALPNILDPLALDAGSDEWPIEAADAVLSINMVHIAPWKSALGLLNGSARVLKRGGPLIVYGPWLERGKPVAASNLEFDRQLKSRDAQWGLRTLEDFEAEAVKRYFVLEQVRPMPANNLMLLFRFGGGD